MTEAPVVEVEGLVRRYGTTTALAGVSLEVGRGELFGVLGPDGAGKTSLFRILATVLLPDAGTARVLGHDVVRDLWPLRRRLGYMPGRFALYPDLTVTENLEFFATVFGTSTAAGADLIAPIWRQIAPFGARRASALSGGMKQKLALCCALVHRPDLLLLDEPTTGVDAVSRVEFWDLLDALRGSGLTIVVSTPYMDEAARCDRVALMQAGQVFLTDTPERVRRGYPRPMLAVASAGRLALLEALRAFPHAAEVWPFGAAVHYTDQRDDRPVEALAGEIAAWLLARGVTDAVVAPAEPTVEDAFIWHMRRTGAAA